MPGVITSFQDGAIPFAASSIGTVADAHLDPGAAMLRVADYARGLSFCLERNEAFAGGQVRQPEADVGRRIILIANLDPDRLILDSEHAIHGARAFMEEEVESLAFALGLLFLGLMQPILQPAEVIAVGWLATAAFCDGCSGQAQGERGGNDDYLTHLLLHLLSGEIANREL